MQDYGKGIPQDTIAKIFEAFYTTARSKGGTGLGLSIVYNIITGALEGEISVESEIDKGTSFTITIPREINEKNPREIGVNSVEHDARPFSGPRIL